jgi:hypothetical protein
MEALIDSANSTSSSLLGADSSEGATDEFACTRFGIGKSAGGTGTVLKT